MIEYNDDRLTVHLLANRVSQWADIYSYIPYEGRVDLKLKRDMKDISLRVPQWVETNDSRLMIFINDHMQPARWNGRYVSIGAAMAGDRIAMTFPIEERNVRETIAGDEYTLVLKGSTVVFIDPPGKHNPLYQRDHYRENQVRWIEKERFVSDQVFEY